MGLLHRADAGGPRIVINTRRVLLFLPLYVVWAVAIDLLFHWSDRTSAASAPLWMTVGFAVAAVFAAAVTFGVLLRRARGRLSVQRQQTYTAILVGVVSAGVVEDLLKGAAFVLLGGRSWWVMIGVYAVGYAVMWAVVSFMLNRAASSATSRGAARTDGRPVERN